MDNKNIISAVLKKASALLIFISIIQNISAYTWKPVVVPAGGCIQDIVYSRVSQGLIYARTDMGGAYRWDNANSVWIPLTDWLGDWNLYGIESIAPDPKNANVVYAAIGQTYNGTNGYIIASSDQGNSWTQYSIPVLIGANNGGNNAGERLAVDPNLTSILYFGSRSNGLWKSTNSGANWSQVTSFPANGDSGNGLSYVIFDPNSGTSGSQSNTIYVGVEAAGSGNSNLYRSTNGGTSWSVVPGGPSGMITPQACLGTDGTLWLVYNDSNNYNNGQIWKLNTGSLAWSNVSPSNGPASGGGYSGICVDAQDSQHAAVTTMDWWGGPDKCFQTTNGGTSWTVISNVQNSWNAGPYANYNNNGAPWTRFCSAYDGGAWYMNAIKIDPFNSNNAIYTTGGGLWSSTNIKASSQPAGINWTFTDYGIEQTAVLFLNASYKNGVFFSCLGDISGMRYTDLTKPAPNKYCPSVGNTNCLDYAENNTNIAVRVGSSGSVASDTAFSPDNGQNWTSGATAPPGYGTSNQMRSCAVAADGSRIIICPYNGYGNPAYTTNSGSSWTTCNGLPSGSDLASDRVNASVIFATNGSNLYRSSDGGANFSVVNSFSGSGAPRAVFGLTGEVWVATGNGLYRFTNNGSTMTTISNVSSANSIGFGKAASGQTQPAVYLTGNVGGTYGFYRCDDGIGNVWVRINDNNHQYGYGAWCGGDEGIYGRMYVGTNGRGTLYCDSAAAATPTNTPVITNTFTMTRTLTLTYTRTPSATASLSPTNTITITRTWTPSSTLSVTASISQTPAYTGTWTASMTPSYTYTRTQTGTPSGTATNTGLPSRTGTPPDSPTDTASPTYTQTASSTTALSPASTATPTFTATLTGTPGNTSTLIRTLTVTMSLTVTPTVTASPPSTYTGSPTSTRTYTPSFTRTVTGTGPPTATLTDTFTATMTPVFSVSGTVTVPPTITFTPTITATISFPTPTATPVEGNTFEVKSALVYPDPLLEMQDTFYVDMNISRAPQSVRMKMYTSAFRLVRVFEWTTGLTAGSNTLSIPAWKLGPVSNGTYYYVIIARDAEGRQARSKAGGFIILR